MSQRAALANGPLRWERDNWQGDGPRASCVPTLQVLLSLLAVNPKRSMDAIVDAWASDMKPKTDTFDYGACEV